MYEVDWEDWKNKRTVEVLALECMFHYEVEVCTDPVESRKAKPCACPCSNEDAKNIQEQLERKVYHVEKLEQENMLKKKWKTHYHGPNSRDEEE